MNQQILFIAENPLLIRIPLLPVEELLPILATSWESARHWHDDTELAQAFTHDLDTMQQWLLFMVERSPFASTIREALFMSSSDLFDALPRLRRKDLSHKQTQKIAVNVFRYLLRMTTRCTPFGLFAGVTTSQSGQHTRVHLKAMNAYTTRTRVDLQWLWTLIGLLEHDPECADQLHWSPNPLLWRSGTRIFLPYAHTRKHELAETISLRVTPLVLALLELAKTYPTRQSLKQQLLARYPDQPGLMLQIDQLCEADILVSELRPPLTHADPLSYLLEHLPVSCFPPDSALPTELHEIIAACVAYDQLPPGEGETMLHALHEHPRIPLLPPLRLATDLHAPCTTATVSSSVIDDAARAAQLLFRLSPSPMFPIELQAYSALFLEKYGVARRVSLLELLDDFVGLGAPPSYQYPVQPTPALFPLQREAPDREQLLFHLACTALQDRQREICLDDDQLARLQGTAEWQAHLPASLDFFFSIAASSQEAIDRGDYLLCVGPRIGAAPAGRAFGRFCDLLGEEASALLTRLANDEQQNEPNKIFAELVYVPPDVHTANVALRPAIRPYEVIIATNASVPHDHIIELETLQVSITAEGFSLWSRIHEKDVVICNTHLLNLSHRTPNIVRFLAAIAGRHAPHLHPFEWGKSEALSYLPRLRSGRIVLSPARWRFPLIEARSQADLFDRPVQWYQFLQQWREKWQVPRYVHVLSHDQTLLLDLENPCSCLDFLALCRKHQEREPPFLQEVLPGLEHAWATGEHGHFLCEWIIPLKRQIVAPLRHDPIPLNLGGRNSLLPAQRFHHLGSGWVYTKLYCREIVQPELLVGPLQLYLRSLMQQQPCPLTHWFFVRYHDPQPHIRLRLHCDPAHLCTDVLPSLLGWLQLLVTQGWISHFTFDCYEREIERYGGLDALSFAERCFHTDSEFVLACLSFYQQWEKLPSVQEGFSLGDIALLSIETFLKGLHLDQAQRCALYRQIASIHTQQYDDAKHFHRYQKRAQRLVGDSSWLIQAGGQQLAQIGEEARSQLQLLCPRLALVPQQSRSRLLSSLVHMHCNRLLANREQEDETMGMLSRLFNGFSRYVPPGITLD